MAERDANSPGSGDGAGGRRVPTFVPGPWRECGHNRGGCTCGQIWSIPADAPVATAIIGDWGDTFAVFRKDGRKKVPAIEMMVYGSIGEAAGKANARLIAAAPCQNAALCKLANEADAILSLAREAIRAAAGNTNLAVFEARIQEARAALAKASPALIASDQDTGAGGQP